ncbi:hypothetical protein COB52_01460 [Candidatus Kaiserbacteria bacterium]|nr:MAG: hypothetical protein COB52_01460 [Candidatus Kaiserbacteria bacterium]
MLRRKFISGAALSLCAPRALAAGWRNEWTTAELVIWILLDGSGSMYSQRDEPFDGSIGKQHYVTQRDGHVQAFLDESVQYALLERNTVVHVLIWAGSTAVVREITPIGGLEIHSLEDSALLAGILMERVPTSSLSNDSTSHFTGYDYILKSPQRPGAKVIIDIATDAGILIPDQRKSMQVVRNKLLKMGVTSNVLAVDLERNPIAFSSLEQHVSFGEKSFVHTASFGSYAEDIQDKLVREILAT